MERYEFEMIPVPAEALNAVGITPGVTVEAFADGSRIVIQKAPEEDFCETYNEDCEGCPYCCPCCGETCPHLFAENKDFQRISDLSV